MKASTNTGGVGAGLKSTVGAAAGPPNAALDCPASLGETPTQGQYSQIHCLQRGIKLSSLCRKAGKIKTSCVDI